MFASQLLTLAIFIESQHCAHCHSIGLTGTSPHPDTPLFRTLSRRYPIEGLAEALAEGLSVGNPEMPEFVFEADDVRAILADLKSIQESSSSRANQKNKKANPTPPRHRARVN